MQPISSGSTIDGGGAVDDDAPMRIEVAHPREYVSGYPMFVALTFSTNAPDAAILELGEARPTSVYARWKRASDGVVFTRGTILPGARVDWYDPGRDVDLHEGPVPLSRIEPSAPSIRVGPTPRRFLTMIGDVEPGCYAVSVRGAQAAESPAFDICVRAPTETESRELEEIRAAIPFSERGVPLGWETWLESIESPVRLPAGERDPLAYFRLERFIRRAPRPLPALPDRTFDAIDPFFGPELTVLRLEAAAAGDDGAKFATLALEAERAAPSKWLDIQYVRGLFAVRTGDIRALEAASDALWDEHHRWAVDLRRRWLTEHPDQRLAHHARRTL